MNTIKIFLAESGRIADVQKDFPLYQGQFNDKLLNVYVPTSILSANYEIQNYIGQTSGNSLPTTAVLNAFVINNTSDNRNPVVGDVVDFVLTGGVVDYYYRYVCTTIDENDISNNTWTSEQVDTFGVDNIGGTNVKIGMVATTKNGVVAKSQNYAMRYLKTLTKQNVEYALYERKLPKAFTQYAGQGQNAPALIINIVNVDTSDSTISSIVTSQTCYLDVMASTMLDDDGTIEASDIDNLQASVNSLIADLADKQDKYDPLINGGSHYVVNAINQNTSDIANNTNTIGTQAGQISTLRNDVDNIMSTYASGEKYVGQMTGSVLPTTAQLNTFVYLTLSRQTALGDTIIFILQVSGGTDKNYKYIYSASGWGYYEIPLIEEASNGSLGIIKGTYGIQNYNVLVDISGGEIVEIYVKDTTTATYKALSTFISAHQLSLNNILNGVSVVGEAVKATQDALGNNIATTYLTKALGASKTYVKDYALPRQFNDVRYITQSGYDTQCPTDVNPQFTTVCGAVGDFTLFDISGTFDSDFQLSYKNSALTKVWVAPTTSPNNVQVVCNFRLTTYYKKSGGTWQTLSVELTDEIALTDQTLTKIEFGDLFSSLGETILSVASGDTYRQVLEIVTQDSSIQTCSVYSNDTYTSTFYLNTNQVIIQDGLLGQQPYITNDDSELSADGNTIYFYISDEKAQALQNNVEAQFYLSTNLLFTGTGEWQIGIRVGDTNSYTSTILSIFTEEYERYGNELKTRYLQDVWHKPNVNDQYSLTAFLFKAFVKVDYNGTKIIIDNEYKSGFNRVGVLASASLVDNGNLYLGITNGSWNFINENSVFFLTIEMDRASFETYANQPVSFYNEDMYNVAVLKDSTGANTLVYADLKKYIVGTRNSGATYTIIVEVFKSGDQELNVMFAAHNDIVSLSATEMADNDICLSFATGQLAICNTGDATYTAGLVYQYARTGDTTYTWTSITPSSSPVIITWASLPTNVGSSDYNTLIANENALIHRTDNDKYYRLLSQDANYIVYQSVSRSSANVIYNQLSIRKSNLKLYEATITLPSVITAGVIDSETATNGQVLTANGNGGASWQTPSSGGIEYVELSTTSGTLTQEQSTKITNGAYIKYSPSADVSYIIAPYGNSYGVYYFSNTNVNTLVNLGGILFATADIGNTLAFTISVLSSEQMIAASNINSQTATNGQVLMADGNGGASWQNAVSSADVSTAISTALTGTTETFTIASADWVADNNIAPYTYKTDVTLVNTLGVNTIVELLNNDAVAFATYGFAIGSINSQTATIYSLSQPNASVNLSIKMTN